MTAKKREEAKKQTEMLAALRKQHSDQVKQAQTLLKEQKDVRKTLRGAMKAGPRTVPQLAEATGLPAHEVLWHVAAMKKYGLVIEEGLNEDYEYYLYALSKEAKP
jgi:predicted Rossmann fold nucleotide-binding protein DprA/Smf involved in DNA uptake